jgi:hypothetical protein
MFDFKEELTKGKLGEALIAEFLNKSQHLNGFNSDFILEDGSGMELKTDFYDSSKTPNFCIERYSNIALLTDGGPWKALNDGSKYFFYLFYNTKELYVMETKALIEYVESNEQSFRTIDIPNKSWVTGCYLVPREPAKHLFNKIQL